jgi:acyl homoserine lactone synthase
MEASISFSATFCREPENPEIVDQLAVFRKELFVDRCGWPLKVSAGRERDEFDTDTCIHCALFHGAKLIGGFRAIATDSPCLATEVFSGLATLQPVPQRRDYWEVSRFGVLPSKNAGRASLLNYALMFHFARQVQAKALVAVADLAYERFLETLGIRTRRYGPTQQIGMSNFGTPLHAVLGEIPLAAQSGEKFERLVDTIKNIEVTDASQIFRPARISA